MDRSLARSNDRHQIGFYSAAVSLATAGATIPVVADA
jgi:hypothetical protein